MGRLRRTSSGLWLGDGSLHKRGAFFHLGEDNVDAFQQEYWRWSGQEPSIRQYKPKVLTCWSRNWGRRLCELGYDWPCRAEDKSIRAGTLPYELDLLDGLWQSDGTLMIGEGYQNFRYGYCRSEELCRQIVEIFARMNVEARLASTTSGGKQVWAVNVRRKHHDFLARRMVLEGRKNCLLSIMKDTR